MQANHEELVERISNAVPVDGVVHPLTGLHLARRSGALEPVYTVMKPSFCVIAQGSKEILLGDSRYQYDPYNYLLTTIEFPSVLQVLKASQEQPYLSLRLELLPTLVCSVMVESGYTSSKGPTDMRAIDVSLLDETLLDAFVRLVRLVESPHDARTLMPLITREIIYRLLTSNQGGRLLHLANVGGYTTHIAKAVEQLHRDFVQPLRIEAMARQLGMSVSGFHHHFKAVTAMSPLQFQKHLRLQEARRLMLNEDLDAASAAWRVGYHDPAYFNRDYKSVFGIPPMRDIQRLRKEAPESAAQ